MSRKSFFFFFIQQRRREEEGREEEEVGFVSEVGGVRFSWLRSLTLHAGGDVGSLTSPTLLSRGLRKVWGEGGGGGSETGSGGRGTGHRRGLTARRGVALTYLCRVLRATPIPGAAGTNPLSAAFPMPVGRYVDLVRAFTGSLPLCLPACLPVCRC